MNIGIDVRGLSQSRTGIPTTIEEVLKRINTNGNRKHKYFLYSNRDINIDFELNDNIIIKKEERPLGVFWLYFKLPKTLQEDNIDVFWGTQHCLPKRNKYTKNIRFVLTIYDLAIKKLKTVGSFKNTLVQKLFLKKSIKHADKIIAISKSTKKDIMDLYKIKEEKISVVYLGTSAGEEFNITQEEENTIQEKFGIKNTPYLFFVSTIEPRKNIETLILAFDYIKRKEPSNLKLIIAGGLGWKYQKVLNLIEKSEYKEDIMMPGFISKEEKKYLYEHTTCFVYPSLYEGFGLPILEAMANKALVVTSFISAIPEVGGNAAFYYDGVLNYRELGNKILEVIHLSKEEKENKINQGLEQVQRFTWDECTKELLEILNRRS